MDGTGSTAACQPPKTPSPHPPNTHFSSDPRALSSSHALLRLSHPPTQWRRHALPVCSVGVRLLQPRAKARRISAHAPRGHTALCICGPKAVGQGRRSFETLGQEGLLRLFLTPRGCPTAALDTDTPRPLMDLKGCAFHIRVFKMIRATRASCMLGYPGPQPPPPPAVPPDPKCLGGVAVGGCTWAPKCSPPPPPPSERHSSTSDTGGSQGPRSAQ